MLSFKVRTRICSTHTESEKFEKQLKTISDYIKKNDFPSWYRGTSSFQRQGADQLLYAIRDDIEQDTTHRVRQCMSMIGLKPALNDKETRYLMLLSQGNDLAFLWFLMDKFYKTTSSEYNLNEQLIMSLIAHLDAITTLRELDRILPPSQPPQSIKKPQKISKVHQKCLRDSRIFPPRWSAKRKLAYFDIQPRPKQYGERLSLQTPPKRLHFGIYDNYKNMNYVVANEASRWYGDDRIFAFFKDRIAAQIISSRLRDIFPAGDATRAENVPEDKELDQMATRLIRDELSGVFNSDSGIIIGGQGGLCEKHRAVIELEKSLQHQLRVIARDKCLEYFDVNKKKREETQTRIRSQLENDVNMYMKRFKRLTDKTRALSSTSTITVISKNDGFKHYKASEDKENQSPKNSCQRANERRKPGSKTSKQSTIDDKVTVLRPRCGAGDCSDRPFVIDNIEKRSKELSKSVGTQKRGVLRTKTISHYQDLCDCGHDYMKAYDYDHVERGSISSSDIFFHAPNEHKPYSFDYPKIFHFKSIFDDPEEMSVRRTFVRAVDSEAEMLMRKNPAKPPTLDEAIKNCAVKLWKQMVNMKKKKDEDFEKQRADFKFKGKVDYHQSYYDPNDKELMHRMLKDALTLMSANPKFVLASMPEAEKLSFLRLWMYRRYGKVYTREELDAASRESKRIFYALDKLTLSVQQPSARDIGPQLRVSYNCRGYIQKKIQRVRQSYYRYLDESIMEQSRDLWFAMSPYFCSKPPRNTYFAYMPSSLIDIHHFRIWKPNEFMDAKSAWMRRNIQKRLFPKI